MRVPLLLVASLLLAGCGQATSSAGSDPATSVPTDAGVARVQTDGARLVRDDGTGPELCVGGIGASYPPYCDGLPLVGWDWAEHEGDYEVSGRVRWGDFHVVGTYDGTVVTPAEVTPADRWRGEVVERAARRLSTPCPEPEGGWRVREPVLTTLDTQARVMRVAARLPGYAGAWVDQSINPAFDRLMSGESTAEDETAMNDPALTVVNVTVAGDPAAAAEELREVWGGMLCVSAVPRSEADLMAIAEEVSELGEVLSTSPDPATATLEVHVTHDDGSLQEELDERYGAGVVQVTSELLPAP